MSEAATPAPAAGDAVLDIADLRYARGPGPEDFRLHLPALRLGRGGFVVLAGESGCGKSTLMELIGLLLPPASVGRFVLAPRGRGPRDLAGPLNRGALEELAPLRHAAIGHVLQQGGLLPFLTVAQNIALTRPADRPAPFAVEALAERLGIGAVLGRLPRSLSIGQRQRAAIARAVMGDPDLILADEPTAALDPPNARAMLGLLREIAAERGVAVLMASHAWSLIAEFSLPVLAAHPVSEGGQRQVRFAPGTLAGLAA